MSNYTIEAVAGISGFLAAIIFKAPLYMENSILMRLLIAVIGGALSAIVGWFIRLLLDRMKERYEDKKRQKQWRDKLDE